MALRVAFRFHPDDAELQESLRNKDLMLLKTQVRALLQDIASRPGEDLNSPMKCG